MVFMVRRALSDRRRGLATRWKPRIALSRTKFLGIRGYHKDALAWDILLLGGVYSHSSGYQPKKSP